MRMPRILRPALLLPLVVLPNGIKSALGDGNIGKVNHIIVVMQENHSFDNYFGPLAYAPGSPYHNGNGACSKTDHSCVNGLICNVDLTGNLTCSNSNLDDGSTVFAFHDPSRCVLPDLNHGWVATHQELNFRSPNNGFKGLSDGFVRVNDATEQIDHGVESATEDQTIGFYNQIDCRFITTWRRNSRSMTATSPQCLGRRSPIAPI